MTEQLRDIRELKDDFEAYRDELNRRWTGLLSYRYIGRNHGGSMNTGADDPTVKVRHDMRNPAGGLMVAPIAITSPEGCLPDLVAVPNPVIQSVQILDPARGVDRIEVLPTERLHQGRTMGYSRSVIVDADDHDRVIAYTDGQGVTIGTPPEGLELIDADDAKIVIEDSPTSCSSPAARSGRSASKPKPTTAPTRGSVSGSSCTTRATATARSPLRRGYSRESAEGMPGLPSLIDGGGLVSTTRPRAATTNQPNSKRVIKATRRRRGEPRRLLLDAARELFAQQGFTNTTAREIADRAGVSEPLLFRHFGSKVGLFREALVVPFLDLVEEFEDKWQSGTLATLDDEEVTRQFLGDLFDRLQMNRGLVLTLWGSDADVSELAESGVCDEISRGLRVLVDISTAEAAPRKGRPISDEELSARAAVAMVAGVALFGQSVFLGRRTPSRDELVEELVQTILHGRLHRGG